MTEPKAPPEPKHGTTTAYVNHKCRCEECRIAWNTYHREYRAKLAARLHTTKA